MTDRYVYLHIDRNDLFQAADKGGGITIHVKLDDEGVVVDAWQEDEVIAGTWKTYEEMGLVISEAQESADLPEGMIEINGEIMKDCAAIHHDD